MVFCTFFLLLLYNVKSKAIHNTAHLLVMKNLGGIICVFKDTLANTNVLKIIVRFIVNFHQTALKAHLADVDVTNQNQCCHAFNVCHVHKSQKINTVFAYKGP